jgi:hypothetical protein
MGQQQIRPGDLWYVDEDLCARPNAAYPTMPTSTPRPGMGRHRH